MPSGLVGQAGFLMSGKDMKKCINQGTLSSCYNIGKMIREARESGKDPVETIVTELGGWCLATGVVTGKETWDDGYYYGYHTIEGSGDDKGNTFKIFFKNENHAMGKRQALCFQPRHHCCRRCQDRRTVCEPHSGGRQ
ncbi:MAG: hypothetical protein ACLRSD_06155 [Oscillibacter sp.]